MLEPHQRALSLVGVPFRHQGRDPATGLDCVGVVVRAFDLTISKLPTYRMTDGDWQQVEQELCRWFTCARRQTPQSNDMVVFRHVRGFHFGVISGAHLVHADLAAGRVVSRKMPRRLGRDCRLYTHRGVRS